MLGLVGGHSLNPSSTEKSRAAQKPIKMIEMLICFLAAHFTERLCIRFKAKIDKYNLAAFD